MRTRTFSEEEKDEIKNSMMEAGLPLLKEYGMTHMSVTKLTRSVGIGKSTFYNFYSCKEEFVNDMLRYHRKKMMFRIQEGLCGRAKYTKEESKQIICQFFSEANDIYQHFTMTDENLLNQMNEKNGIKVIDLSKEKKIMDQLFSVMEGVKNDIDYPVVANLIKLFVLSGEQRHFFHKEGFDKMRELILVTILNQIFEY